MASIFKPFAANDMTATRTYLHEAIPITGTIISGTYPEPPSTESNCKNFAYYQAVYDYPYLSSSANHLFDITLGYSADSALADPSNPDNDEKIQIYNQFAQVLVGYDATGSIRKFDADGDFSTAGDKMNECIFIPFSRLLVKDEVQKGTFDMEFGGGLFIGDYFGSTEYKVNSPAGEYAIVYEEDSTSKYGLLYYQAGVLVITGAIADDDFFTEAYITGSADGLREGIKNIEFNNTTELNSTIYFCRLGHNEFNYSSNPTYLSGSEIIVKAGSSVNEPKSYVTSIGLYSSDNALLGVAKLSQPISKTPSNEYVLRCRLDY